MEFESKNIMKIKLWYDLSTFIVKICLLIRYMDHRYEN